MTILVECERYFKARQESQKIVWEDDRTTIRKYCDNIKIYETKSLLGDFFFWTTKIGILLNQVNITNSQKKEKEKSKYYKTDQPT